MDSFLTGCLSVVVLYMAVMWLVVLGVVAYGSGNPGWLQTLASLIDEPPPKELTERDFLLAVAFSVGVAWPIYLAAFLSRDGRWRG